MKVLWFSLSPCGSMRRKGGKPTNGSWLIALEDALKKESGIELSVAYFTNEEKVPFTYDGVKYYPMYLPNDKNPVMRVIQRFSSEKRRDNKMLPIMLDVVRQSNPDLIHIHGTEGRFGLIQDYINDTPIVYSIQGLLSPYKKKYFAGIPQNVAERFDLLYDKLRGLSVRRDFRSLCFRAQRECVFLQHANYILGRTFWDRDITLGLNPNRKYFVADEVLRHSFYKCQWQKNSFEGRKLILITTISGAIYKGFETLLESAHLMKKYSGIDFEWRVIGYEGNNKFVRMATRMTKIKTSDVNIHFLGRLNEEELASNLCEADIYVHTSHIENSPNSVCEAMLVGMPVVASYAGGTASLLNDGVEGLLYQDGDPYVLAGRIVYLYNHYEQAKIMGNAARKRALMRHDSKRISGELIKTYYEIARLYDENQDTCSM